MLNSWNVYKNLVPMPFVAQKVEIAANIWPLRFLFRFHLEHFFWFVHIDIIADVQMLQVD